MKSTLIISVLLVCISPLGWAQITTLDRETSAKKVQACFQSQVNEHAKAIKQFENQIGKNYKRIEELEEELELRKEVSKIIDGINKKIVPEVDCTENPEESSSIEGKIKAYKSQNLVLKSFYELNQANLAILQNEVPLIESYLKFVKLDGFGEIKLLKRVVEQERVYNEYAKSINKQNVLKDSLKLNLDFPDCTSTIQDLKKLHISP